MDLMGLTPDDAGELLRGRGMRSTPQRRAILSVFHGGRAEHLSADEVYARASRSLPDLSRGTVYATLAEFSELGLLSAFGSPEPVRYETNVDLHAHFRCRLCLRVFDLSGGLQDQGGISDPGFTVERVETRAEGICDECAEYDAGLHTGAGSMRTAGPSSDALSGAGSAVSEIDSPLGKLLLGATSKGLTRVAFEDHADVDALRTRASSRRGSQAARQHLLDAAEYLHRYFASQEVRSRCAIDWEALALAGPAALMAAEKIPFASHRSYSDLDVQIAAHDLGLIFGANPIPIVMPCHRVSRGHEIPTSFVGGAERRRWLDAHESAEA
jgi:Fe2+ or Zn2+ uptake regulation protein/O6-methylguanine-DNA--protein-cysteine methyltransferase